jgi:hypothetical protein
MQLIGVLLWSNLIWKGNHQERMRGCQLLKKYDYMADYNAVFK